MSKQLIVDVAYKIHTSKKYGKVKKFFYNLLENDSYKYKKFFDAFMITLIFISVIIFIREVKSQVSDYMHIFNNYIISIIFLIEYIIRLWISSSVTEVIIAQSEHDAMVKEEFNLLKPLKEIVLEKLKYMLSIKAIVDFMAIIPFFHELRLLRIFILFRVFKLFRYAKSTQIFTSVIASKKFEFLTLLISTSIVVFIASVLVYVMEANNPASPINTLFDAIYWSVVTISTVGYGDVTPVTEAGRTVAMFVIVSGVGVISFTTSLMVSAFTEKLDEIKDQKLIDDIVKIKEFYLICGYENVSKEVARRLVVNNKVIILEEDLQKSAKAKKDGFIVLNYDPGSLESYKKLRINLQAQVKAILCLSHSDVENVYTALTIRSFDKDVFILSILINKMNRNKLIFAGVNEIFYEKELVGAIAKEFVGQPVAFEVIHALRSNYNDIDMQEIVINSVVLERFSVTSQINAKKFRVLFLGIYKTDRKEFLFNPPDETSLEFGDYLLIIGHVGFVEEFVNYLHKGKK